MVEQTPEVPEKPIQPEVVSEPQQNKNYLKIVLLVILGLVIAVGAVFAGMKLQEKRTTSTPSAKITPAQNVPTAVPTEDLTVNWKTYTNSQYGYTIKYPSNISFKQDRFYFIGDDNRKDTADGFGPNVSIFYRGSDMSPRQVAQEELSTSTLKDVTINNAIGVQVINPTLEFDYYLKSTSGNNVIRLTFSSQDYSPTVSKEKIQEMEKIATQMLSTFKFIE